MQHSESKSSTFDFIHYHTFSTFSISSKSLHDHISAASHCTACTKFEATMYPPTRCRNHSLDHLLTVRSTADEHKLVDPTLNFNIFDKEERQRQKEEEQNDWGYDNNNNNKNDRQLQQKVKEDVTIILIFKKIDNTHLFSKDKSLSLLTYNSSSESSQNKLKSYSNNFNDNELNNNPVSITVNRESRFTKWKRLSLFNNLIYKKHKYYLEQRFNL